MKEVILNGREVANKLRQKNSKFRPRTTFFRTHAGQQAVSFQIALAGKRCSDQRAKVAQAWPLAGSQRLDYPASLRCVEHTAAPPAGQHRINVTLVVHTDPFKRDMQLGFISFARFTDVAHREFRQLPAKKAVRRRRWLIYCGGNS